MRHHRTARALAVAGALALLAAPAHAADTAPPGCASAVVEVGWVTSHHDGRYLIDRVLLDGLEECAGAELVLALGAGPGSHEVTAVVPASGALDLDVAGLAVPAAHLDRVAVLVDGHDLTPTTPITPTPAPTAPAAEPAGPAVPTDPDTDPDAGVGAVVVGVSGAFLAALAGTGVGPTGLVALAAALVIIGALLRRRHREDTADA